jgi:circadian clock protein KaiC
MLERLPSGIPGLDEMIEGGFPTPAILLLLGEPGTGKTTFAMQSLFYGAEKGEVGIYMTGVAEPVFMIKKFMSNYNFYNDDHIKDGKIQFWDLGSSIQTMGPKKALDVIIDIVRETNATRVIIDPLPLSEQFSSATDHRKYLYDFLTALRNLEVFTIIIGEKPCEGTIDLEAYLVDGVILLYLQPLDNPLVYKNLMHIRKLRGTDHTRDMLSVDIKKAGMCVFHMEKF